MVDCFEAFAEENGLFSRRRGNGKTVARNKFIFVDSPDLHLERQLFEK